MSEQLEWARWWAFPWKFSHNDWGNFDEYHAQSALCHPRHVFVNTRLGIEPCLPPTPHSTILRLALAPQEQLESMLALLDNVCRPATDSQLSQDQYEWCQRLSKALRPDTLLSGKEDPLQLLRAWVTPAIWQRLRLRFERRRTPPPEEHTPALNDARNRLDTLWQAIVWRATTMPSEQSFTYQTEQRTDDVEHT